MKKIKYLIVFLGLLVSVLTLTACGNQSLGLGHFTFNYVYCIPTDTYYKVSKWHDNEIGIEIKTENCGSMWFSEGTYILYEKLPDGKVAK